ncbi:altronate dehydratase [Rhodophyticola sp. CCM32]|uniref:UxaA family hydrolase n=1 Tax=Rhodophyticola sp. CCM32 TaxID=2916397 RepID=UPI00107FCA50|nr:altronate dehydratase family protein [Rhodophyticola sp. CCM32]QBY00195.1 altronate dehydratase [Rhodophyticola sp. CCM32]
MNNSLRLHSGDNIVLALRDLPSGSDLNTLSVPVVDDIPRGHKIASAHIAKGAPVLRFGQVIGQALRDIAVGEHVHSHNLGMSSRGNTDPVAVEFVPDRHIPAPLEFLGYRRSTGRVGTRNYIGIITTVNCSGSVARFIAEEAAKSGFADDFANIDGIVPIVHSSGCGMSDQGEGFDTLLRTLMGYTQHPNFGGILLLGLGCEVMQVAQLAGERSADLGETLRFMTIQGEHGTKATIERAIAELREIAAIADQARRSPVPVSEITLGLQCGGSDSYSGISANPALGHAADLLVHQGATVVLSETPEIFGAEHLLLRRAAAGNIRDDLVERLEWWEEYLKRNGAEMNNNPSPGNKKGGLTTILEKSLGAVAKAGSTSLNGVFKFGEKIDCAGLVFMDSPGYDPCSVTGQIASGANLIAFTTGRGSVSGYQPTPCLKIASNTEMYARMVDDMDVNCGDVISDGVSLEQKGQELFAALLQIASGQRTKSELQGFGGVEFVPWQIGATL